ncbi:lysine N(6)-hydroxylase/L-ornithine N(5)-oxygenase family protein [Streptomyces sp. NPDC058755]|uniref:lysine N(6)-hydroxylase/L-ornithine N(5)-oxygenase family protein n=1 Tax=Streptomyces sp. NPDC058755 TaxID=3346624 RepID=UPI0036BF32EB
MESSDTMTYDVVGAGFGPANLSLAVALQERREGGTPRPTAAFFERKPQLGWHRGMLLPGAKMQISFLKDLVTFRNPASPFSFVSYLHAMGRLPQFVNNQDFFATRQEFHDYLEWAEAKLAHQVTYGAEITQIRPPASGRRGEAIEHLEVEVRGDSLPGGTRVLTAHNIVISTGLVPRMPAGVQRDERVWHSSEFLDRFTAWNPGELNRVAVVGAGQSAAEVVRYLHDALPDASITAILPPYGYALADNTPFANRVFDPSAVDDYYYGSERSRDVIWQHHRNTNYSVVDDEVIKGLHERVYGDEVAGRNRIEFLNLSRVCGVKRAADETRVTVMSVATEETRELDVDVLVCATGYDPMNPAPILGELDSLCLRDARGRYRVERDYRIATAPELRCGIYLQGGTEHTHGLTSSLLSNLAVRSGEIVASLLDRRK